MTTVGLPAAGVEKDPVWMPRKVAAIVCASRRGGAGGSGAVPRAASAGGPGRGAEVPGAGVRGLSIGCPSSGQAAHRVIVARGVTLRLPREVEGEVHLAVRVDLAGRDEAEGRGLDVRGDLAERDVGHHHRTPLAAVRPSREWHRSSYG